MDKKTDDEQLPRGVYRRTGTEFLWIRYGHRGQEIRESSETTSVREAVRIRKIKISKLHPGMGRPKTVMLGELYANVETDYRIKHRASVDDIEARWRCHLEPFFGHLAASDLSTDLVNAYILNRQQQIDRDGRRLVADATINRTLALLKRMMHLGQQWTPPKVVSVPVITMLTEDNARSGFLELDRYLRLTSECVRFGPWLVAMLRCGATYGWRHAALLKMRVGQIDLVNEIIRLEGRTNKNKQGVEVMMTDEVREALRPLVEGRPGDDPLFVREDGTPVRDFRGAWRSVTEAAGVPGLLFHDLRRTAARNMRRYGLQEQDCMDIGGWKTSSMFKRYSIVDNDDRRQSMAKFKKGRQEELERLEKLKATGTGESISGCKSSAKTAHLPHSGGKIGPGRVLRMKFNNGDK